MTAHPDWCRACWPYRACPAHAVARPHVAAPAALPPLGACARCAATPAVEWRDDAGRLLCGTCALACADREGLVIL